MGRASRFIWALDCGKKDRRLFFWAIQILRNIIERTGEVTLVTDGERRYGNLLFEMFHLVGLFVIGVTLVSAYNVETDQSMRVGQTLDVAGHQFELRELRNVQGPNFSAIEGSVEIRRDGEYIGEVRPQKRQYLVQKNWMTEAGIEVQWNKDLFVALGDQLGDGAWSVRVQYKPMIRFIWLGTLVMALGGLIAISDRRYRVNVREKAPAKDTAAEAAA